MTEVIANLVIKGEYELARKIKKVYAFDTRFNLMQDEVKCVYLLDVPLFDKHWEAIMPDGTRKLVTDEEARDLLKKEKEYNDRIREKAVNQLKNITKFAKMGDLTIEEMQEAIEEAKEQMPQADNTLVTEK